MNDKLLCILFILCIVILFCGNTFAADLNGTVNDVFDDNTDDYVGSLEDAVAVENATVTLTHKTDKTKSYTTKTNNKGSYSLKDIDSGDYELNIDYKTYSKYAKNITIDHTLTEDHTFIPDIAIITYSGTSSSDGNQNKLDMLINKSSRVYSIESTKSAMASSISRNWLLEYANFILVDMFIDSTDYSVTVDEITNTPANEKGMIAYTFGMYTDVYLNSLLADWNFLGGTETNNTPHTLENTYIGSYWQAEVVSNATVVKENMENMLDYIFYLLGETTENPTSTKGPLLAGPTYGLYHPDYGIFGNTPSRDLINTWINNHIGYNEDGVGSLNWMTKEYYEWSLEHNTPESLLSEFEIWYNNTKTDISGSFIVIASYYSGGTFVDEMIHEYEKQNRAVVNLFQSATQPSISSLLVLMANGKDGIKPFTRGVVAVNSLYSWSLDYVNMANGGAIKDFKAMNIDIIRALNSISETGYQSEYGPQAEWTYSVTIPQFEGVFGSIPVSYIDKKGNEIPIPEGIAKIVELSNGWAKLKEKNNNDKKVAIILYNYPPGKAELGASYLEVFQSLNTLLNEMYDNGYNIGMDKSEIPNATQLYTLVAAFGNKGTWAQGLLNDYVEENWEDLIKNQQFVNVTQYMKWFNELPEKLQNQLVDYWGEGIGNIMKYNGSIVIPGMMFGNVFLTVQPSRGTEELKTIENYHDTTLPPHQQYVSFYKWLKDVYGADAMIHLGTHGTLEWLPGRLMGMQSDDWTFQLSSIPNIYPYIVSNPGEGMVAKDRAFALVISHMTPATITSSLYGNLTILNDYIKSYDQAIKVDAVGLVEEYKIKIMDLAESLGYDKPSESEDFDKWLNNLHNQLENLDNDLITYGLHNLGKILEGDELLEEVNTISSSRTLILDNIKKRLYPDISLDYYTMIHDYTYSNEVDVVQAKLRYYISSLINGTSVGELAESEDISSSDILYSNLNFVLGIIADLKNNHELQSIINALNGGYVVPGLSADPSYSDSIPTGTSIYSADSTKIPSQAAWETSKKMVDKFLHDYYYEHNGAFPEIVGLIMWGTEISRTEGYGIAEFLYLLGVTPVWSPTGNNEVIGVKAMDLSELTITLDDGTVINRPRIDAYASIVINNARLIKLMTDAVALVNGLNETYRQNYLKKHYDEQGSLDRLFGLEGSKLQGTGVSDLVPNTSVWENSTNFNADLTEVYLNRVSYAWTVDDKGNIIVKNNRGTYEYLLKNVDYITQNIDSTWRFLDSDDYYDWFGGMLGASQYLGGNPDTGIIDVRDKNNMFIRNLNEELEFEVRSTILNPTYYKELLNTPSGWLSYAKKYENSFGFLVSTKDTKGNKIISDGMLNQMASNILGSDFNVDTNYKAVSFESMSAWMLTASRKGMWNGDKNLVTQLANKYITSANEYGIACCHHTCANLAFTEWVISVSSLSNAQKQKFSDMMEHVTGQRPKTSENSNSTTKDSNANVKVENANGAQSNSENSNSNNDANSNSKNNNANSNSQNEGQTNSGSNSAGENGANSKPQSSSQSQSASSTDSASEVSQKSQPDSSAGESGDSKAYEVNTGFSETASNSQVSAAFIGGIIFLLMLFGIGYFRRKKYEE